MWRERGAQYHIAIPSFLPPLGARSRFGGLLSTVPVLKKFLFKI